jgi:hypothetical protein
MVIHKPGLRILLVADMVFNGLSRPVRTFNIGGLK